MTEPSRDSDGRDKLEIYSFNLTSARGDFVISRGHEDFNKLLLAWVDNQFCDALDLGRLCFVKSQSGCALYDLWYRDPIDYELCEGPGTSGTRPNFKFLALENLLTRYATVAELAAGVYSVHRDEWVGLLISPLLASSTTY
jgi:hypothetical protein